MGKNVMPKKLAFIDMDGTIANHHEALHRELEAMAGPGEGPIPTNPHGGPDHIEARIDRIHKMKDFWLDLKPIGLGFYVADALKNLGFDLHILTKGPRLATVAWTEKKDWCLKYMPDVPVTITENKAILRGDVLFDDYPPYVEGFLEANPEAKAVMLAYDYNEYFNHERVLKIRGPQDIEKLQEFLAD